MFAPNLPAKWLQSPKLLISLILLLGVGLRAWSLASLPNGLHWDEMDTGFQAQSLFTTGRDIFGSPMPLFTQAFADFRTPVYIYSAVPLVASLGLNALAVRLSSVFFGVLSMALMYVLASRLFSSKVGLLAGLVMATSLWAVQYSRQSVETISLMTYTLLAVNLFIRGLKNPKTLILSGLFFALATACYSPGKLFIPLLVLGLLVTHWRKLVTLPKKYLTIGFILMTLVASPVYWDSLFGKSGLRFSHLSIFTDPTIATEVDYKRLESTLSSGVEKRPGISPRLVDKLIFNKPAEIASKFFGNYLSTFSFNYLFIQGDAELRHSPNQDWIGMLFLVEVIPLVIGLIHLRNKTVWWWLLLAPIPAALTRDGGSHAARTLIILPALIIIISFGLNKLLEKSKILFGLYSCIFIINLFFTYGYFFNYYRVESAKPFQYGFDQAIKLAIAKSSEYDQVIVDGRGDSLLMAYLFYSGTTPAEIQRIFPMQQVELYPGGWSFKFKNIYLLQPNTRDWSAIFTNHPIPGRSFIIAESTQPNIESWSTGKILYPDAVTAFDYFSK